jgi:hypothetical protein
MQLLRSLPRSRLAAAMLGALAATAVGSIAWAGIPDNEGVIHGCYKNANGALRVIDIDAGGACSQSETAIESGTSRGLRRQDTPGLVPGEHPQVSSSRASWAGAQCGGLPGRPDLW